MMLGFFIFKIMVHHILLSPEEQNLDFGKQKKIANQHLKCIASILLHMMIDVVKGMQLAHNPVHDEPMTGKVKNKGDAMLLIDIYTRKQMKYLYSKHSDWLKEYTEKLRRWMLKMVNVVENHEQALKEQNN